jgi:hypothetical protein
MILMPGETLEEVVYDDMKEVLSAHSHNLWGDELTRLFRLLNLKTLNDWVSLFDTAAVQRIASLCHIENQLKELGIVTQAKKFYINIPAKISPPKMTWWQRLRCWLSASYKNRYYDDQFEYRNVLAQEIAIQNGWVECHPIDPAIQAEVSRIMRKHGL